ncbi:TIGR03084 family metal-binding protein [Nocardioides sp. Soil805]|uniref:TIGR03084 family metal-binding protein n=1 Tax=Nocardioides sp. Soil805 TaxID=1736416 RepID=UPI00070316B9|nr:TIGR03084 family metal-binding protein [Nocardioides sp. Soil805]KRF34724.1 wyosine base formation domain-containing protein [Nocardioides sp. Soil805]
MTDVLRTVLTDLAAEGDRLDALVADLDEAGWRTPTPAAGWDVATQVGHLSWTDEVATLAARAGTPEGKAAWDEVVIAAIGDPDGFVDASALEIGRDPDLLDRWRQGRKALATALAEVPTGEKLPWFGPPMSPTSMATARFMETWAHGLDVHDALGVEPEDSTRIRHVAHLGVRTRNFAFATRGLAVPGEEFRIDLAAPDGDVWSWGPEDAAQTVTGSAGDFCRLVTQRVHRGDTDLVAVGPDADRWLDIAQAFAGPPGEGRAAR